MRPPPRVPGWMYSTRSSPGRWMRATNNWCGSASKGRSRPDPTNRTNLNLMTAMDKPWNNNKETWYSYQREWLDDPRRFKIGLWARQTGKDHTASAEAVADCLKRDGANWVILAVGERQAVETLRKAGEWAARWAAPIENLEEKRKSPQARLSSTKLEFANGSRI